MKYLTILALSLLCLGSCTNEKTSTVKNTIPVDPAYFENAAPVASPSQTSPQGDFATVLARAKELCQRQADNTMPAGFKSVFSQSAIVSATGSPQNLSITTEAGKTYMMMFIVPDEKLAQQLGFNDRLKSVIAYTKPSGTSVDLPAHVFLNPRTIKNVLGKKLGLDWAATVLLHEQYHFYQYTLMKRAGVTPSFTAKASMAREIEAYDFQGLFLSSVAADHGISTVQSYAIQDSEKSSIQSVSDLEPYFVRVDELNNFQLGEFVQLILYMANKELYVSFANGTTVH